MVHVEHLLRLLIFIVSLCLCLPSSAAAEADNRAELRNVKQAIQTVKKQLAKDKSNKSKLENQLKKIEQDIGATSKSIRQADGQIKQLSAEIKQLDSQLNSLEETKKQQQDIIQQYIRSAYQSSQQSTLKLLLNQEKPNDVARMLEYYDHINRARHKKLEEYQKTINQINELKPKIQSTQAKLVQEKKSLEEKHRANVKLKSQRKNVIAGLNKTIKTNDQKLKKLSADRERLTKLIQALEKAITSMKKPSSFNRPNTQRKALPWPLKGKIINKFGSWRQQKLLKWQGVFIAAKEGSSIKPIHYGQVIFADWLRGHGLLIIIDHGEDYLSLYAHNRSLLKSAGDWVDPNDVIATVGNSGGQTRSGLYFEIRHKGQPINPLKWCCG